MLDLELQQQHVPKKPSSGTSLLVAAGHQGLQIASSADRRRYCRRTAKTWLLSSHRQRTLAVGIGSSRYL